MDWNDALVEVIDLRTFSNVWYWLAISVAWSVASHWIIGVPFDMIFRAKRYGGEAARDLEMLIGINVRRLTTIAEIAGLWIVGLVTFIISALTMAGFYYGFELAQGILLMFVPLSLAGLLTLKTAQRFSIKQPSGEQLVKELLKLRFWIQVIALPSIFFTAMYGMYHNLSLPLGF